MAFALTIGGVAKALKRGTLNISKTANGRSTLSLTVESLDGSYRPPLDAEVIATDNGVRIFGGLIDRPREKGLLGGKGHPSLHTAISAVDFHAYTERRFIKGIFPGGSLKSALEFILPYLSDYGVTLDGGQATGPSIPALEYEWRSVTEALNELVTLSGKDAEPFVWRIDAFKVLSMFQPSTVAAPFNLIGNDLPQVIGDIEVEETRDHYANRIILRVPSKTEMNRVETFTGDGSTTSFQLQYTVIGHRGYVGSTTTPDLYETLTTTEYEGTATWTYDQDTNTLNRTAGALADGETAAITFDGTFTGEAIADAGAAPEDVVERVVTVEVVPEDTTAQALADAYLAQALIVPKTIKYRTLESGLEPGQVQTITVPRRNLDITARITDVSTRDFGKFDLMRDVTLIADAESNIGKGWRDVYKLWAGDLTGGGKLKSGAAPAMTIGEGTIVGSGGAAPPHRAVQFNRNQSFGGDAAFIYYEEENSVVCGGGGSSITAADFESCQVFGYNNHIADPAV